MDIFATVQTFLAEQLDIAADTITPASSLKDDLKADSLDIAQMVMYAEETFNIEVDDDAAGNIATVGDIVNYVAAKLD